ncbi:MAG: DNA alkylation repair protein [Saprospiraceae bacterium]
MSFSLKDQIYSPEYVNDLAVALQKADSNISITRFKHIALNEHWPNLELKERMRHLTTCLYEVLPKAYQKAIELLDKTIVQLPQHKFANLIFPDFVEQYGIDDLETSLKALELYTQFGSSEFGIRPFIKAYEKETMTRLIEWADSENVHVRRLASEGCRPRLPWAMALPKYKKDPAPILPILEKLKADPEDYVYRSVANNLNDISKDHPDLVLEVGERWYGQHPHTDWAVKHALRTLLKKGNTRAMRLFGFGDPAQVEVSSLTLLPSIKIGEQLLFSFDLNVQAASAGKLRLEYAVDYLKKLGTYSRKVFKISENTYESGRHSLQKKQWFKDFSTRKHYPGQHHLTILVNGVEKATISFNLLPSN